MLAARFYFSDRRREARAQAQQIRVVITACAPTLAASVWNYSDRAIYDLAAETRPMTLHEWLVYRNGDRQSPVKADRALLAALREKFAQVIEPTSRLLAQSERVVHPGSSVQVEYAGLDSQTARFLIAFRDHMHRRCRLEFWPDSGGLGETHTRLTLSYDKKVADRAWDLVRHPIKERANIRGWLAIWWWERRHHGPE